MFLRQISKWLTILEFDMLVLWDIQGSCYNICGTMAMEGSTDTEVYNALILCDVITSPCSSEMLWM